MRPPIFKRPENYKRPLGCATIEAYFDASATMPGDSVVWWYARVLAECRIGHCVSIGGGTELGRGTIVGNHSRIGANCFFPPHSVIGEYVFVGPGVNCADDMHPKVPMDGDEPYEARPPIIEDFAVIGIGCVLLPGVRIGHHAFVAAGSVVTSDVAPHAMVKGQPARVFVPSAKTRAAYLRMVG